MTGQQAVRTIDRLLDRQQQPKLNDLQSKIVLQIWEGHTYGSIANLLSYDLDYIKQIAARLWKLLSKLVGENICKSNIKSVLERCQESRLSTNIRPWLVADRETSQLLSGGFDRGNTAEIDLDNSQTWMISDRRTTIAFLSTATNETSRSSEYEEPVARLSEQQIQSQIQSLVWQNLSDPANSTVLINEIFLVLKVRIPAKKAINCLIVNCYF
jgi:hypothetical protein